VNITLLAADLMKLWLVELALVVIPASIIGAGISWVVGRWYACLLLSYAAAIAFCNSHHITERLHHSLNLIELLGSSAALTLPPILLAASAGYLTARKVKRRWTSTHLEIDNNHLLPKWVVRLIWLGSIAVFQALEFQRYLDGLLYRPFFALFTAVIVATFVWFIAWVLSDMSRRQQSRVRS
jgi:hypothetical protein